MYILLLSFFFDLCGWICWNVLGLFLMLVEWLIFWFEVICFGFLLKVGKDELNEVCCVFLVFGLESFYLKEIKFVDNFIFYIWF